jgi:23S rRNA (uracil1939-C5)-methyltransferase
MAELVEIEIEKIAPGGDGLGKWKGKWVFVPMSLPGERLRVRVESDSGDYLRAAIEEILSPSKERRPAACRHYAECGGCALQHASRQAQLECKRGILEDAFRRVGSLGGAALGFPMESGAEYACRNRFQFHGGQAGPGLMSRLSSTVIALEACPIAVPAVNAFLVEADAKKGKTAAIPPGSRRVVFGSSDGLFIEGRDRMAGATVLDRSFRFPCSGFFQSNLEMLGRLVRDLADFLPGGEALADLYGGVGTFSAFVAGAYRRVSLVEENPASAAAAERNLGDSGVRLDIQASSVEDWMELPQAKRHFDAVICDPPRSGLSASARRFFVKMKAPRLAYVSCDPVSLARDLGFLLREGYGLEGFSAYDFYPQTAGVESLARLRWEGSLE